MTLIAGPVSMSCSANIHRIDVESCEEMYQAATTTFANMDAAILCAAVADFRPENVATEKIKREKDDLVIRLKPTHDIAAQLGEANAQKKLQKKNLDFIVLNSLQRKGTCFQSDDNQISILSANGQVDFDKKPKTEVAKDIVNELSKRL